MATRLKSGKVGRRMLIEIILDLVILGPVKTMNVFRILNCRRKLLRFCSLHQIWSFG